MSDAAICQAKKPRRVAEPIPMPLARINQVWADPALRGYAAKARALGVAIGTLHRWAKELDLPNRPSLKSPRKLLDEARLRAVWADADLSSMAAKAAVLGCGVSTLSRAVQRLGLPRLAPGPKPKGNLALMRVLWLRGVSSAQIGRVVGMTADAVQYHARVRGLPRRGSGYVPPCTVQDVVVDLQQAALLRALQAERQGVAA